MTDPRFDESTPEVGDPGGAPIASGHPASYGKLPTAPVDVSGVASGPDAESQPFTAPTWVPPGGAPEPEPVDDARLAPWALVAAVVALATSMFVGWGIPVAVIAVIAAIMSLRRATENREVAMWALVLGLCATLFSLGWLIWAAMQFESLG